MFTSKRTIRAAFFALGLLLIVGLGAGTAGAQEPYELPSEQDRGAVASGSEVLGESIARPAPASSGSTLPLTGGEILTITLAGGALVVLGGATVAVSRRRRISGLA